ncbi:hypothetical protein NCCP2716_06730 [Sporosarcina sp. NCCP-2716]|uniref:hypothetical protein n=1 Tax=Sporosarcina sp. NCCP-2716 TaxID=2943679 RepID=UPI00203AB62A|nr:hypothetical protein [Sporosarcina sp. NCCP-2716]GKV68175.1 hypothetical protein NCCP2716_06730 [Sporosarcina sp. NCCP-2716]
MQKKQETLREELLQPKDVRLLEEADWALPAVRLAVTYTTVEKTTMDILMKMILLTLKQLPVDNGSEIAGLLGVEPLFVDDLLLMMERDGLALNKNGWSITEKGIDQLEAGLYIHAEEQVKSVLTYCPLLQEFYEDAALPAESGASGLFRCAPDTGPPETDSVPRDGLASILAAALETDNTENRAKVISGITEITVVGTSAIPCFEYRLYNESKDMLFARVWNTAAKQWDGRLEEIILAEERTAWRKQYKL